MTTAELRGLPTRFGATVTVDGLTASVAPGSVTAFPGPNGAGTTTMLRILPGLAAADGRNATTGRRRHDELQEPVREAGLVSACTPRG